MTWLQRYRVQYYLRNSIWVWPTLAMLAALVAVRVLHEIDKDLHWVVAIRPEAIHAVLATLSASMFTFIVFVSSALLVAVQLASSALTPRIIASVFGDRRVKISLVIFVFSFTFTLATLVRVGAEVPPVTTTVAVYSCLVSLGVFLFLIDHVGKALRPSGALWSVAKKGRKILESVYPHKLDFRADPSLTAEPVPDAGPVQTILSRKDGVVLAYDLHGLLAAACRFDGVIELTPQVGDFIAAGDPLFRVYRCNVPIPEPVLRSLVAVGQERTVEQDPTYAFRMLVDIASKGLSPAINDPTTAVLALDQIHHLLRNVGRRRLDDERVRDASGVVRLLYRTPDWEDFVRLAVTEIRQFGGTSIQIARRLRAMLENLIQTLPAERVPLLRQELAVLNRSAARCFSDPEDLAMAEESDFQGVGGKQGRLANSHESRAAATR